MKMTKTSKAMLAAGILALGLLLVTWATPARAANGDYEACKSQCKTKQCRQCCLKTFEEAVNRCIGAYTKACQDNSATADDLAKCLESHTGCETKIKLDFECR